MALSVGAFSLTRFCSGDERGRSAAALPPKPPEENSFRSDDLTTVDFDVDRSTLSEIKSDPFSKDDVESVRSLNQLNSLGYFSLYCELLSEVSNWRPQEFNELRTARGYEFEKYDARCRLRERFGGLLDKPFDQEEAYKLLLRVIADRIGTLAETEGAEGELFSKAVEIYSRSIDPLTTSSTEWQDCLRDTIKWQIGSGHLDRSQLTPLDQVLAAAGASPDINLGAMIPVLVSAEKVDPGFIADIALHPDIQDLINDPDNSEYYRILISYYRDAAQRGGSGGEIERFLPSLAFLEGQDLSTFEGFLSAYDSFSALCLIVRESGPGNLDTQTLVDLVPLDWLKPEGVVLEEDGRPVIINGDMIENDVIPFFGSLGAAGAAKLKELLEDSLAANDNKARWSRIRVNVIAQLMSDNNLRFKEIERIIGILEGQGDDLGAKALADQATSIIQSDSSIAKEVLLDPTLSIDHRRMAATSLATNFRSLLNDADFYFELVCKERDSVVADTLLVGMALSNVGDYTHYERLLSEESKYKNTKLALLCSFVSMSDLSTNVLLIKVNSPRMSEAACALTALLLTDTELGLRRFAEADEDVSGSISSELLGRAYGTAFDVEGDKESVNILVDQTTHFLLALISPMGFDKQLSSEFNERVKQEVARSVAKMG